MAQPSGWLEGIEGNFRLHENVAKTMPEGTKVTKVTRFGDSAWTKTARIDVTAPDGSPKSYFLKTAFGPSAKAICEGEYVSAKLVLDVVPGMVPEAYAWGMYVDEREINEHVPQEHDSDDSNSDSSGTEPGSHWTSIASESTNSEDGGVSSDVEPTEPGMQRLKDTNTYFYIGEFREMDFDTLPDPDKLLSMLAQMHSKGTSENGMFGFPVPTACGRMQRTVTWEKSWAASFAHQLKDVMKYDLERHGSWPEFEATCKEIIDVVVPKILEPLQANGRVLKPSLCHGDFWEKNIAIDRNTGGIVVFDPGCTYAHNEIEFGTWRSQWATHFVTKPEYKAAYDRLIQPSEPKEQYNDRLRLYIVRSHINGSAGDYGTELRKLAYNDMLFLCEKYGTLQGDDRYNPENDLQVSGAYKAFDPTIAH